MNTQRVPVGLLSHCGRLVTTFGRSCKSYIVNDEAEQEWAELAWTEAAAEPGTQQSREHKNRAPKIPSFFDASE